jgi:hypothetical protein
MSPPIFGDLQLLHNKSIGKTAGKPGQKNFRKVLDHQPPFAVLSVRDQRSDHSQPLLGLRIVMKKAIYVRIGAVAFVCAGIAVAALLAGSSEAVVVGDTPLQALGQAATPEVPVVAARLVAQAAPEFREAKALEVVRAVNAMVQPASLPYVVNAIAQSSPEVAAVVVAEAAALRPELAPRLARAALDAAPLARPVNNVALTPIQMSSVERLGQVGIAKAEAQALAQLGQPSSPAVVANPPVAAPVAKPEVQVGRAGETPLPITVAVPTQQGPTVVPPLVTSPPGPFTPITIIQTTPNPGHDPRDYSGP